MQKNKSRKLLNTDFKCLYHISSILLLVCLVVFASLYTNNENHKISIYSIYIGTGSVDISLTTFFKIIISELISKFDSGIATIFAAITSVFALIYYANTTNRYIVSENYIRNIIFNSYVILCVLYCVTAIIVGPKPEILQWVISLCISIFFCGELHRISYNDSFIKENIKKWLTKIQNHSPATPMSQASYKYGCDALKNVNKSAFLKHLNNKCFSIKDNQFDCYMPDDVIPTIEKYGLETPMSKIDCLEIAKKEAYATIDNYDLFDPAKHPHDVNVGYMPLILDICLYNLIYEIKKNLILHSILNDESPISIIDTDGVAEKYREIRDIINDSKSIVSLEKSLCKYYSGDAIKTKRVLNVLYEGSDRSDSSAYIDVSDDHLDTIKENFKIIFPTNY